MRKRSLRGRIQQRRHESTEHFAGIARPLAWIDAARAKWREIAPFTKVAAVPLGFLLKKTLFPKANLLGLLLRWGPLAWSAWKARR